MDFIDRLHELAAQLPKLTDAISGNEEATKNALVMPFMNALGYNVFNPTEVVPEFTADVGTKKGEKVDYAVMKDGKPIILIECKSYGTDLAVAHASQLYRYFSVTEARFGVLTNGVVYNFFSDVDAPNKMDQKPFLVFDLRDISESVVAELKKFTKTSFDIDNIVSTASELKYTREIKRLISVQMTEPDDAFVRYFAAQVYPGRMVQTVREQFANIVRQALKQFVNDQINERLKSALASVEPAAISPEADPQAASEEEDRDDRKIVTSQDEIDGYFVVKSILREVVDPKRVKMRDTKSYCGILLDDNSRRPICRLHFNRSQKYLGMFDSSKNETRIPIKSVDDIYQYAEQLKAVVGPYLEDQSGVAHPS